MNLKVRILLISLAWICQLSSIARAADCFHVSNSEYLIHEAQTPEALADAKFIPSFNKTYFRSGSTPIWIKAKVRLKDCQKSIMWQAKDFRIKALDFWQYDRNNTLVLKHEFKQNKNQSRYRPYRHLANFPILSYSDEFTFYFRLGEQSRFRMHFDFITAEERLYHEILAQGIFLLFVGLCAGLSIYNLYLYLATKDPLYLRYVAFVVCSVLAITINDGNADWLAPVSSTWHRIIRGSLPSGLSFEYPA